MDMCARAIGFDYYGVIYGQTSDMSAGWEKDQCVNTDVIDLIRTLRSQGYKIGLLSNYKGDVRSRLREQKILDLFDVICTSSEIGVLKLDPRAFLHLCNALHVQPVELIFVDDTLKNTEGAARAGCVSLVFHDVESLRKQLCDVGVCI